VVVVPQSHGCTSADEPLVTGGVYGCTVYVGLNLANGNAWMWHCDSNARHFWSPALAAEIGSPTSPCTPEHGLLRRERSGYDEFCREPGDKRVLQVQSRRAHDRRELRLDFEDDDIGFMPPLILATGGDGSAPDESLWNVAFRPETGQLLVHVFNDAGGERVLHFDDVFASAAPWPKREAMVAQPDLADLAGQYVDILRGPAALAPDARRVLELCVHAVRARNYSDEETYDALQELIDLKPEVAQWYTDDMEADRTFLGAGSSLLRGLSDLARQAAMLRPRP
jgi:hypothetical protein